MANPDAAPEVTDTMLPAPTDHSSDADAIRIMKMIEMALRGNSDYMGLTALLEEQLGPYHVHMLLLAGFMGLAQLMGNIASGRLAPDTIFDQLMKFAAATRAEPGVLHSTYQMQAERPKGVND